MFSECPSPKGVAYPILVGSLYRKDSDFQGKVCDGCFYKNQHGVYPVKTCPLFFTREYITR